MVWIDQVIVALKQQQYDEIWWWNVVIGISSELDGGYRAATTRLNDSKCCMKYMCDVDPSKQNDFFKSS